MTMLATVIGGFIKTEYFLFKMLFIEMNHATAPNCYVLVRNVFNQ